MGRVVAILIIMTTVQHVAASCPEAAPSERAECFFAAARGAMDGGELSEAEDLLSRALELAPAPKHAFALAIVYQAMGRFSEAHSLLLSLQQAEFGELSTARQAEVAQLADDVADQLAQIEIVMPEDEGPAAEARIDGAPVATLAAGESTRERLDPGVHQISVHRPRVELFETEVQLVRGDYRRVEVTFESVPSDPRVEEEPTRNRKKWLWLVLAAAVVGGAIATALVVTRDESPRDSVWGRAATLISY